MKFSIKQVCESVAVGTAGVGSPQGGGGLMVWLRLLWESLIPLSAHSLRRSGQEVISLPRSCHIGVGDLAQWFTVLHPGRLGTEDRDMFPHLDLHS